MLPQSAYSCAGSWAVPCVFLAYLDQRCTGRAEQVRKSAAAYCIQILRVVDGKLGIISSADAGLEAVASRPAAMAVNASGPRCPNHEGRRVQPVSCIQISTSCARHRSIFVPGMYIPGGTAVGFRRRSRLMCGRFFPTIRLVHQFPDTLSSGCSTKAHRSPDEVSTSVGQCVANRFMHGCIAYAATTL